MHCDFDSRLHLDLIPHNLAHSGIPLYGQTEKKQMSFNQSLIMRFLDLQSDSGTNLRVTESHPVVDHDFVVPGS